MLTRVATSTTVSVNRENIFAEVFMFVLRIVFDAIVLWISSPRLQVWVTIVCVRCRIDVVVVANDQSPMCVYEEQSSRSGLVKEKPTLPQQASVVG